MSFSETIFLFFLALVIFGPKKLPEIARQVGKYLNEFKRASNEFKAQIEQEIAHLEVENPKQTILPPSPPVEGTTSRTLNSAPSRRPGRDLSAGRSCRAMKLQRWPLLLKNMRRHPEMAQRRLSRPRPSPPRKT